MKGLRLNKNGFVSFAIIFSLISSCMQNPSASRARPRSYIVDEAKQVEQNEVDATDNKATQTENPFKNSTLLDTILETGNAELIHLIDPRSGSFKKKVTIEKNYAGFFYLSGLNITSLRRNIVKVRFTFGHNLESIVVPATVGRAPGLTPQSEIEVLILDFSSRPFENLRLLYDLYDYNDYRDDSGEETKDPTVDPYDSNLYCRGLRLEHDPTFEGTSTNSKCDEVGEKCLYAYAKVVDNGIAERSDREDLSSEIVSIVPSLPQIDISGSGYQNENVSVREKRCLPDSIEADTFELFMKSSINPEGSNLTGTLSYGDDFELSIDPTQAFSSTNKLVYYYRGPYRSLDTSAWQISIPTTGGNGAVFSGDEPTGVFKRSFSGLNGYGSYMFPRRAKMELKANVQHMSIGNESSPFSDSFSLNELLVSGETSYMYGCSKRMSEYDEFSKEGIQSCNVTAKIEILAMEDGNEFVMDTNIETKLQVIRPSVKNYLGEEVLYTSMKSCSASSMCASDECCFNDRCWHNSLVSQCKENDDVVGYLQVGERCNTDLECSSFCCNPSSQVCSVHTNTSSEQVLCSKPPEASCISKEFCRKENIVNCFIVTTGVDPLGNPECALRCYNMPTHGDCINNKCRAPSQPAIPVFDPENPDCDGARTPPTADEVTLDFIQGSSSSSSGSNSGSSSGGTSGTPSSGDASSSI